MLDEQSEWEESREQLIQAWLRALAGERLAEVTQRAEDALEVSALERMWALSPRQGEGG